MKKKHYFVVITALTIFLVLSVLLNISLYKDNKKLSFLAFGTVSFENSYMSINRQFQDYRIISRSSTTLSLENPTDTSRVYLVSYDEQTLLSTVRDVSCLYPNPGARIYRGHYQLIVDSGTGTQLAKLDLGELEFVEGTSSDGTLDVQQLLPHESGLIAMYQEAGCKVALRLYGYDPKQHVLVQYMFQGKDVSDNTEVLTESPPIAIDPSGTFTTHYYYPSIGRNTYITWHYNALNKQFDEINSWTQ